MTVHLIRRNTRSLPWAGKEALAPIGEQNLTGHDIGLRTSKFFFPSKELGSRILRGYCGAKGSGDFGPFHIKPKVHAEEEETSEDEQRKPKLPGYTTEDNPVLGRPKSRKGKRHVARGSPLEHPKGSFEPNGPAIGAWWRSNSRRGCHLCIKCPQLTVWPH